jgi:hypothetical protein
VAWIVGEARDEEIESKDATRELVKLISSRLGQRDAAGSCQCRDPLVDLGAVDAIGQERAYDPGRERSPCCTSRRRVRRCLVEVAGNAVAVVGVSIGDVGENDDALLGAGMGRGRRARVESIGGLGFGALSRLGNNSSCRPDPRGCGWLRPPGSCSPTASAYSACPHLTGGGGDRQVGHHAAQGGPEVALCGAVDLFAALGEEGLDRACATP